MPKKKKDIKEKFSSDSESESDSDSDSDSEQSNNQTKIALGVGVGLATLIGAAIAGEHLLDEKEPPEPEQTTNPSQTPTGGSAGGHVVDGGPAAPLGQNYDEINEEQYNSIENDNDYNILIFFGDNLCPPCVHMLPQWNQLVESWKYGDNIHHFHVNIHDEFAVSLYNNEGTPTIKLKYEGEWHNIQHSYPECLSDGESYCWVTPPPESKEFRFATKEELEDQIDDLRS